MRCTQFLKYFEHKLCHELVEEAVANVFMRSGVYESMVSGFEIGVCYLKHLFCHCLPPGVVLNMPFQKFGATCHFPSERQCGSLLFRTNVNVTVFDFVGEYFSWLP